MGILTGELVKFNDIGSVISNSVDAGLWLGHGSRHDPIRAHRYARHVHAYIGARYLPNEYLQVHLAGHQTFPPKDYRQEFQQHRVFRLLRFYQDRQAIDSARLRWSRVI